MLFVQSRKSRIEFRIAARVQDHQFESELTGCVLQVLGLPLCDVASRWIDKNGNGIGRGNGLVQNLKAFWPDTLLVLAARNSGGRPHR
jgi:hypothetical protein